MTASLTSIRFSSSRPELRLEFPQRQVGLLANQLTDPVGKRRPQRRPPPRQAWSNLVPLTPLLLDPTHPRLTHTEVHRHLTGAPPPVTGREHLTTELF